MDSALLRTVGSAPPAPLPERLHAPRGAALICLYAIFPGRIAPDFNPFKAALPAVSGFRICGNATLQRVLLQADSPTPQEVIVDVLVAPPELQVIVTGGASSGIGESSIEAAARRGANPVFAAKRAKALVETQALSEMLLRCSATRVRARRRRSATSRSVSRRRRWR